MESQFLLPCFEIAEGKIQHAGQGLGIVGPNLALQRLPGLLEKYNGLAGLVERQERSTKPSLHGGHNPRVTDRLSLELGNRPVKFFDQDRLQWPFAIGDLLGIEAVEDRAQYFVRLGDLGESLLGDPIGLLLRGSRLLLLDLSAEFSVGSIRLGLACLLFLVCFASCDSGLFPGHEQSVRGAGNSQQQDGRDDSPGPLKGAPASTLFGLAGAGGCLVRAGLL